MRWRCVAHHFRVKRSKVKVIGVVRSFGLVRSVAPSLLDRFTSYVVYTQPMRWRCVAHHFRVKRSKVKVTGVVRSFGCVRSVLIGPIHFICGTHATHEVRMCRAPFPGQKVKGQGHSGRSKFCRVRSMAPSLLDRFTSYVVYTQPMRWRCVAHHFRVKRSKVKVTGVVWSLCCVRSEAPSLLNRITSYVVHTQPVRWRCIAHHFRVERSKVKVTGVVRKFWTCPLRGSVLIGPIHFICGTHTTHEVAMCHAPFLR